MDNLNQVIEFGGVCGDKRVYNEYQRMYNPCKICAAKDSARYHQANRDKIIARSKLYQENTKYVRKSHKQQIEELNKKVEQLIRAMETLILEFE